MPKDIEDIKINFVYDDSPESEFRLFQALKMLLAEDDLLGLDVPETQKTSAYRALQPEGGIRQ